MWEREWLARNWAAVCEAIAQVGQPQLAGALGPGRVDAFDGETLTVVFARQHDALRLRCSQELLEPIEQTLAALSGRAIGCRFIVADEVPVPASVPVLTGLSTQERNNLANDPAVRSVMGLFGGDVVDIRRETAPAEHEDS